MNPFKFIFPALLACLLFFHTGYSQSSEIGVTGGLSSYRGELNPVMYSLNTKHMHPALGMFFRRNINAHWSFRLNVLRGKLSGNDAEVNHGFAKNRNLSFKSPLFEIAPLFEFNFLPFEKYGSPNPVSPYVFAGIGIFHFSPTLKNNAETYVLKDLDLEGKNYGTLQVSLPMGAGIKFRYGPWVFGVETGPRKSSTDYIDDVSTTYLEPRSFPKYLQPTIASLTDTTIVNIFGRQRGNSRDNDWYLFTGINISYKLGDMRRRECQRLLRNQ